MHTPDQLSPKIQQKRRRILRTALKIFAQEGFRNTDVQVVADRAGVGKGTVYRHFGNKEQLFLATARFCLQQLSEFVEQQLGGAAELPERIAQDGTAATLREIARACAAYYQQHPQAVEIMIQERAEFRESVFPSHLMFRKETRGGLDELMRSAIARGELRNVDVLQATNAFADLIYGSVVNGCLEGAKADLVQRVEQAVDMLLYGLVASECPKQSEGLQDAQLPEENAP